MCFTLSPLTQTPDDRDYPRERSRSPGPDRDGDTRIRDEPNGRSDRYAYNPSCNFTVLRVKY